MVDGLGLGQVSGQAPCGVSEVNGSDRGVVSAGTLMAYKAYRLCPIVLRLRCTESV